MLLRTATDPSCRDSTRGSSCRRVDRPVEDRSARAGVRSWSWVAVTAAGLALMSTAVLDGRAGATPPTVPPGSATPVVTQLDGDPSGPDADRPPSPGLVRAQAWGGQPPRGGPIDRTAP